ncbi:MAG: hypothetical protein QXK24_01270 [Ignisphaera sp.]
MSRKLVFALQFLVVLQLLLLISVALVSAQEGDTIIILDLSYYVIGIVGVTVVSVLLALLAIWRGRVIFAIILASLCLMSALLGAMYVISPNALIIGETEIEGIGVVNATRPIRIQVESQSSQQVFSLCLIICVAMFLVGLTGVIQSLIWTKNPRWMDIGVLIASCIVYITSLSSMVAVNLINASIASAFAGSCIAIMLICVGIITVRKMGRISKYAIVGRGA